jgi:hypothetical protein
MNQNNGLSLLVGVLLGGVATYFAIKHQDDIMDKISDLEESMTFDRHELIESAKEKLEALTATAQATFQKYAHGSGEKPVDDMKTIMEELHRLQAEVNSLKGY